MLIWGELIVFEPMRAGVRLAAVLRAAEKFRGWLVKCKTDDGENVFVYRLIQHFAWIIPQG